MKTIKSKKKTCVKGMAIAITLALAGETFAINCMAATPAEYTKDENVYGKLNAYGKVNDLYVVNQFHVTKAGDLIDFGRYDMTENLTDLKQIKADNNKNTVSVEQGNFYYQGDIHNGVLPWNLEIEYYLNGQKVEAQELAGASGKMEIHIKTSQNNTVDDVFYDNYMMQISMTLKNALCENIKADTATIADAGESRQINFTVMPKVDSDLVVAADIEDFEMDGISIAGISFTMSVDLPDTSEMAGGLVELSDGISSLNDGTMQLSDGATSLSSGMVDLNGGIQTINNNMGSLSSGGQKLKEGSSSINNGLKQLNANGNSIVEGSTGISNGLSAAELQLKESGIDTANIANDVTLKKLQGLIATGDLTPEQYKAILTAVGTVSGVSSNYTKFNEGLKQYIGGVGQIAQNYGEFDSGLEGLSNGLTQLSDGYSQLAAGSDQLTNGMTDFSDGVTQLADGTQQLADGTANMPDEINSQIDEMTSSYVYDFEPTSFVSDQNQNVNAVQFVLTTDAIKKPEKEIVKEDVKQENFIDRFVNLFKGIF